MRMVPCSHAASVDHVPDCSLLLSAGRTAASRASVVYVLCHVISAFWLSWDYFFDSWSVCEMRVDGEKESSRATYDLVYTRCLSRCLAVMTAAAALALPPPSPPPPPSLITPSSHLSLIV